MSVFSDGTQHIHKNFLDKTAWQLQVFFTTTWAYYTNLDSKTYLFLEIERDTCVFWIFERKKLVRRF